MTKNDETFLERWLVRLEKKFEKQDEKLDRIEAQTSTRFEKLEEEVFNKVTLSDLPPAWKDPRMIQVVLYISLAFLLLVAAVTKFDLGNVL